MRGFLFYKTFLLILGLKINSNFGSKVRLTITALSIAIAIKIPKYILGMKFDRIRTRNPIATVVAV
jgi:hypothetical protein